MRRILSLLLVLLALLSLVPVAALAATEHTNILPYETSVAVKARAVYKSALPEFPIDDGAGGGKLPDGTEIEVDGAPDNARKLVVRKIAQSETGPYTWFKQVLSGKGELFQAYEIYFLDANRERIAADNVSVTLSVPGEMKKAVLYSVATNGGNEKLTETLTGSKAKFTANGSHYYVFAGYKSDDSTSGGSGVKTGDMSNLLLWSELCAASLLILLLMMCLLKKQKKEESK